jgi:periplasmic protein TonB
VFKRSTSQKKNNTEYGRSEFALGRCLVEGDPEAASLARRTRRKSFGVSLTIEILLLVLLVAAPLFTSVAQPQLHQLIPPQLAFFGAWHEHSPAQHVTSTAATREPVIPNPFPRADVPVTTVNRNIEEEPGAPVLNLSGEYIPGAIQVTELARTPPPVEPPHIAQPALQEKRPVKISEGVLGAQLVSRVEPQYPIIAKQTRTEGTVRLHAIISRDGRITSLEVISGHPFLVKSALDAVRQWRYRPTLLNGEPVEVETSITVIFRLHE